MNVVVIGAGNGGIAAAVALAQQGLNPLVLEQHNMPGGCATSFVRGRFEFDASIHVLMYTTAGYKAVWADQMGIDANLAVLPEGITYSYIDENGKPVCRLYPTGAQEFTQEFAKNHPNAAAKMGEFMSLCGEIAGGMGLMHSPNFTPELMNEKFPHFFKLNQMTGQQVFDEFDIPVEVTRFVGPLWWYLGPSIEDIPFNRLANSFFFPITTPVYYPRNTCHEYLAKMEQKIRECGGDIWYNTEVTEIVVENDKVCGIKTNKGDYIATNNVLSNASPRVVLEKMIKEGCSKREELLAEQKGIHENYGLATVYLGLNATAEELGIYSHHLYFTDTDDFMATYRASETFDGPFAFGALCPNIACPDFSPEGTCVLSLTIGMQGFAVDGMSQEDYVKAKQELAHKLVESASFHLGVNLFDYIEEIEVMTPVTLARYAFTRSGSVGYARDFESCKQNEAATEKLNSGAIEGLSFVGQFAYGIGYANNLIGYKSGVKVAKEIKEAK